MAEVCPRSLIPCEGFFMCSGFLITESWLDIDEDIYPKESFDAEQFIKCSLNRSI